MIYAIAFFVLTGLTQVGHMGIDEFIIVGFSKMGKLFGTKQLVNLIRLTTSLLASNRTWVRERNLDSVHC